MKLRRFVLKTTSTGWEMAQGELHEAVHNMQGLFSAPLTGIVLQKHKADMPDEVLEGSLKEARPAHSLPGDHISKIYGNI